MHAGIVQLLGLTRRAAARDVIALMTATYWKIGLQTLSGQLPNLAALATKFLLPCSAYACLLSVKNEAVRTFYETEAMYCGCLCNQGNRIKYRRIRGESGDRSQKKRRGCDESGCRPYALTDQGETD